MVKKALGVFIFILLFGFSTYQLYSYSFACALGGGGGPDCVFYLPLTLVFLVASGLSALFLLLNRDFIKLHKPLLVRVSFVLLILSLSTPYLYYLHKIPAEQIFDKAVTNLDCERILFDLSFSSHFDSQSCYDKTGQCENLKLPFDRDKCYADYFGSADYRTGRSPISNSSQCFFLESDERRNKCLVEFKTREGDLDYCHGLNSTSKFPESLYHSPRFNCYHEFAINNDESWTFRSVGRRIIHEHCDDMGGFSREFCFILKAQETLNVHDCNNVTILGDYCPVIVKERIDVTFWECAHRFSGIPEDQIVDCYENILDSFTEDRCGSIVNSTYRQLCVNFFNQPT